MAQPVPTPAAHWRRMALTAAAVSLVAGCSTATQEPTAARSAPTSQAPSPAPTPPHAGGEHASSSLPSDHVHGAAVNPADEKVYLATHDGLYRYDGAVATHLGPVIDLMGFTVAGPDHFYASGHPGAGMDLPNPVGLIETTDAGLTWSPVSRQGRTDFHAMTASGSGVVGWDGAALLSTPDGQTWTDLPVPVAVHAVAASPDGALLIATSEAGLARSVDAGATWTTGGASPLLQVVHFADAQTVVGATPDGTVHVSTDGGATWTEHGAAGGPPQAVTARTSGDGTLDVVVVTTDAVVRSQGDAPFAALTAH